MNLKTLTQSLLLAISLGLSSFALAEPVWIDVRSQVEHTIDNIEGDVRISHKEIVENVSQLFPNKNAEINLYCRSGGRAGIALSALQEAGYTNVKNVGGINDARELRGIEE